MEESVLLMLFAVAALLPLLVVSLSLMRPRRVPHGPAPRPRKAAASATPMRASTQLGVAQQVWISADALCSLGKPPLPVARYIELRGLHEREDADIRLRTGDGEERHLRLVGMAPSRQGTTAPRVDLRSLTDVACIEVLQVGRGRGAGAAALPQLQLNLVEADGQTVPLSLPLSRRLPRSRFSFDVPDALVWDIRDLPPQRDPSTGAWLWHTMDSVTAALQFNPNAQDPTTGELRYSFQQHVSILDTSFVAAIVVTGGGGSALPLLEVRNNTERKDDAMLSWTLDAEAGQLFFRCGGQGQLVMGMLQPHRKLQGRTIVIGGTYRSTGGPAADGSRELQGTALQPDGHGLIRWHHACPRGTEPWVLNEVVFGGAGIRILELRMLPARLALQDEQLLGIQAAMRASWQSPKQKQP